MNPAKQDAPYSGGEGDAIMDILNQSLEELINAGGFDCACGRHHSCGLKYLKIGPGAVQYLVDALKAAGRHEGLYHLR